MLEKYDLDKFVRFIYMGKAMIDYATEGDLENFKRLFAEADVKEIMYWHIQKSLKAAVKSKQLLIIEFIIEDLDTPLHHEAFEGFLHNFLFFCQEAELEEDPEKKDLGREVNRQILRYLVKGYGKGNCDEADKKDGSTPLMTACERLMDQIIIEILVEQGGAEVNSVSNDDDMPLKIIKKKLEKDPENYDL